MSNDRPPQVFVAHDQRVHEGRSTRPSEVLVPVPQLLVPCEDEYERCDGHHGDESQGQPDHEPSISAAPPVLDEAPFALGHAGRAKRISLESRTRLGPNKRGFGCDSIRRRPRILLNQLAPWLPWMDPA